MGDLSRVVVTVSASYGAGGSVIAPRLAERLGVPFLDRLLSADVSESAHAAAGPAEGGGASPEAARAGAAASGGTGTVHAGGSERSEQPGHSEPTRHSGEAVSDDELAASPASRLFTYLARTAALGALGAPPAVVEPETELREHSEAALAPLRAGQGGVVLGRGGAVALASLPRAYHVRLDGPTARRVTAAARLEGISEERAAERLTRSDRARELWVRRLYGTHPKDPSWYHLWLDTTVLGVDASVDLLVAAVERFVAAW